MRAIRPVVVLVIAGLLLATPGQAQIQNPTESTPTTLFFHIFDPFNKFVINTQGMDADFFEVGGTNNPTVDGTPLDAAQSQVPGLGPWDLNTMYGTSTAGPVEYDFIENGKPRFHPEPGIAQDVLIDDTVDPVVYLYLDLRDFLGSNGLPTMSPAFTFEVTVNENDNPGRTDLLDAGDPIMHGKQTFHLADSKTAPGEDANAFVYWSTFMVITGACGCGDAVDPGLPEDGAEANDEVSGVTTASGESIVYPDEEGIVQLAIPLTIEQDFIPKTEAFNVRIDWYQLEDVFGEDAFASGYIRFHASVDKQPHMELAIKNPVYVEFLHPQVAAGTLLIHTGVNSPWGTYDVDVANMKVTVDGPSVPQNLDRVIAQNQHVHGLHDQAAEVTYLWKFRDEGAKEGDYTITIEVPNMAGTAVAKATAGFTIEGKKAFGTDTEGDVVPETVQTEANASPGLGPLVGLAVLGAAFLARRRSA